MVGRVHNLNAQFALSISDAQVLGVICCARFPSRSDPQSSNLGTRLYKPECECSVVCAQHRRLEFRGIGPLWPIFRGTGMRSAPFLNT